VNVDEEVTVFRIVSMLCVLLGSSVAVADDGDDYLHVLLGTNSAFDGNPASMRLSVRGELGLSHGPTLGASVLIPVTVTTTGESGFGFSSRQTLVEIPLSLRGRLFPNGTIRPYGDIGAGIAVGTGRFGGWLFDTSDRGAAFMTRTALGLEIGNPQSVSLAIEPVSWANYFADRQARATYGFMIGIAVHL
jgi:hypothetical protein